MAKFRTQKHRPNPSSELDIESLLGAPFIAASHANAAMAREQTKFMMDFCFQHKDDKYTPVMIEMHLHQGVIEPGENDNSGQKIRRINTTFQIPLLTLIPINSLGVETVDVAFELDISSQHEYSDEQQNQEDSKKDNLKPSKKTKLKGKISYDSSEAQTPASTDKYRSRNASKLKVNMHANQLPLPVGVKIMLDIYSKSILPEIEDVRDNDNQEQNK